MNKNVSLKFCYASNVLEILIDLPSKLNTKLVSSKYKIKKYEMKKKNLIGSLYINNFPNLSSSQIIIRLNIF